MLKSERVVGGRDGERRTTSKKEGVISLHLSERDWENKYVTDLLMLFGLVGVF